MRFTLALAPFALSLAVAPHQALADPGTPVERVVRASNVDQGFGAVIISIRSELYLDEPLSLFFLREGGDITNDADVVRFERRQGFFALGNNTVEYRVRAYQLRPGTYRLVAHGMDCHKVPAPDERCLVEVHGLTGRVTLSRPSRGYGEQAPLFEIRAGAVTNAGDYALTARNVVEWSPIPASEASRIVRSFDAMANAPQPQIPDDFKLKYGLRPRSYDDDRNRRF